ncbi:hypothetical protein OG357_01400 [Streptomyces sp. NBC_01255]|uniref:hypothetical protein n=1 Tax=Streptomyces sp. NBC_01255 TaxID=2903798 RepID=UPI002E300AAE|nr:hypothetical protein [Streptomyces sp. NBC_01255]
MSWWLWALLGVAVVVVARLTWRIVHKRGLWDTRTMGLGFGRDEHGGVVFLDTANNWADSTAGYDRDIAREVDFRGPNPLPSNRPPGTAPGEGDWGNWWLDRIRYLREDHVQNSEKHIVYIIQARRLAGLPELEATDDTGSG